MALCNFTRNLRMFLHNYELEIENKQKSLGKTVLKIWSQIWENMSYQVQKKTLEKKCAFKLLIFMCFYFFCTFFSK